MRDNIVVKRKSNIPLVTIALAAAGGSSDEDENTAGITGLVARTSVKGTKTRSATEIALQAERMGGSVTPSVGADLFDWEITVPSKHFDRALDLLADVAYNPRFPEHEFDVERKLTLADLQQSRDDMFRYPLRLCLQQAFAGHPYGNSLQAVERTLSATTVAQAAQWHRREIGKQSWAFAVGDVDPDTARKKLQSVLIRNEVDGAGSPPRAAWHGGTQLVESREKNQTALALGFPGPDRNHPDSYVLQVLANAVGGLGGRFFEELRSKRSLAYTVSLMPVSRWLGGVFIAYIGTSPDREDEARTALLEQFDLLRNELISDDEVRRAKSYTIGTWQIRSQTNGAQLGDLMHAYMLGEGEREITEFADHIEAVTPQAIRNAAQRYFDPSIMVEGVVRGLRTED